MRNLLLLLLTSLFCFASSAQGEGIVWSDEFSSGELNDELWRQHYPGERFSGFNDASAIGFANDSLTITVESRENKIYTGMISTRGLQEVKDGYIEIKAKFPEMRDGLKCSALLQSPSFGNKDIDPLLKPENTGSVITLFQLTATTSKKIYSSVTWGNFGDMVSRVGDYASAEIKQNEFHVFGLQMSKDAYEFYLDGRKYLEVNEGISGVDMYLVLSCEVKDSLGVFNSQADASQFEVDYVRYSKPPPIVSKVPNGTLIAFEDWNIIEKSTVSYGNHDSDYGFVRSQPSEKEAIKVTLKEGSHFGIDASYLLPENVTEAWVSYCMRFSGNWTTQIGGKLPGFAGDSTRTLFNRGGQGGAPSDGTNSWSARMVYGNLNTTTSSVPVGSYVYHTDQGAISDFGEVNWWAPEPERRIEDSVSLEHHKWYAIKQHLKVNSVDANDGLIEGWVNGKLVYQRDDFNFTNAKRHRMIHRIWLDVYHGGSETSPSDQDVYFDQFNYSIGEDNTSVNCVN